MDSETIQIKSDVNQIGNFIKENNEI